MPRGKSKGGMSRSSKKRMQKGRKTHSRSPREESFFHDISSDSGTARSMKEDEF